MKRLVVVVAALALSACAGLTFPPEVQAQSASQGAKALADVQPDDLSVAQTIAQNHGDTAGAACAQALSQFLASVNPPAPTTTDPAPVGPASRFEATRVAVNTAKTKADAILAVLMSTTMSGPGAALKAACAPVIIDAEDFVAKLGALVGGLR